MNGGIQAVPVESARWEGWLSSHSTHFQSDMIFMSLLGTTSQNITHQRLGH